MKLSCCLMSGVLCWASACRISGAELCNPAEVWEAVIAAKGGRERLHAVNSIYTGAQLKYWSFLIPRKGDAQTLFVLPDRVWTRTSYPGTVFGTTVYIDDYGAKRTTAAHDERWGRAVRQTNPEIDNRAYLQAIYLLETRWMAPQLKGCVVTSFRRKKMYLISSTVQGENYGFYVDPTTHLVRAVTIGTGVGQGTIILSDYYCVAGIMMFRRERIEYKHLRTVEWRTTYEINPDYDPGLFTRRATVEDPDAWRKR